jgi:hypothetical protein
MRTPHYKARMTTQWNNLQKKIKEIKKPNQNGSEPDQRKWETADIRPRPKPVCYPSPIPKSIPRFLGRVWIETKLPNLFWALWG